MGKKKHKLDSECRKVRATSGKEREMLQEPRWGSFGRGSSRRAPWLVSLPCDPLMTWVSQWCIVICVLAAPHHMHASGSPLLCPRASSGVQKSICLTAGASQAESDSQLSGMRVGGQVPWQLGRMVHAVPLRVESGAHRGNQCSNTTKLFLFLISASWAHRKKSPAHESGKGWRVHSWLLAWLLGAAQGKEDGEYGWGRRAAKGMGIKYAGKKHPMSLDTVCQILLVWEVG